MYNIYIYIKRRGFFCGEAYKEISIEQPRIHIHIHKYVRLCVYAHAHAPKRILYGNRRFVCIYRERQREKRISARKLHL